MQGRHQFNSESRRKKGEALKGFLSHEVLSLLSRWTSKERLIQGSVIAFGGYLWVSGVLQNDSNNVFLLHIVMSPDHRYRCWCRLSQLVTICYFPLAKMARQTFFFFFLQLKREKHFANRAPSPCEICVCVKLFTTSERSTLGKCYLKEDTIISGDALGSQRGALHFSNTIESPSHTEKPFPAHTRTADGQPF